MDPFNNPKFKKLSAQWEKRLKKSGFEDIENGDRLKRHDVDWFHNHIDNLKFQTTRDFYLQATKFLAKHDFQTKEHEHIWMLFSEGKTPKQIANHVTLQERQILRIITRYTKVMQDE